MAKLKRSVSKDYADYFEARKSRNKGVIPKDTWTHAQWTKATSKQRALAKAGIGYKKVLGMK